MARAGERMQLFRSQNQKFGKEIGDAYDDDEEFLFWQTLNLQYLQMQIDIKRKFGGSVRGKKSNIEWNRQDGAERLLSNYFGLHPVYNANMFRRRFRMRRSLFEGILGQIVTHLRYFVCKRDALSQLGFIPEQKITAALRMLAYGSSVDQLDEVMSMGESTVMQCLENFCSSIIDIFEEEYLREPTCEDLKRILAENAARGWPGLLGSLDYMQWAWKNCPVAWKCAFQGKEKEATIILEAICDKCLWLWHFNFRTLGSANDINVLDRSSLFDSLMIGKSHSVQFIVNGHGFNKGYYLVDGIYPKYDMFVSTISNPQGEKRRHFAKVQEATRKDVERCFDVLQQRFRILVQPCKLWRADAMHSVIKACTILHNMIVEDEFTEEDCDDQYLWEDAFVGPPLQCVTTVDGIHEVLTEIQG